MPPPGRKKPERDPDKDGWGMMSERVSATPQALALMAVLENRHGPIVFHLSGECCGGSNLHCRPEGDFRVGPRDFLVGEVDGAAFYVCKSQFEHWRNRHLVIDVERGRSADASLECSEGVRFVTRGRPFSFAEARMLAVSKVATAET